MSFEIKRSPWPAMYQFFTVFTVLFGFVWLCKTQSFYFYPLAILFIGNRIYALSLLGHEATHGLIFRSQKANLFFARYFCYFPILSSQSHYSQLHFMHHRFVNSDRDPDILIYNESWKSKTEWLQKKTVELITGKISKVFFAYFAGFPHFLKKSYVFRKDSDHFQLIAFWILATILIFQLEIFLDVILFWFLPLYFWLPWIQLTSEFQHYGKTQIAENGTRSFAYQWPFLNSLLFPLNINLHEAHHKNTAVPFYQLPDYTRIQSHVIYSASDVSKLFFNSDSNQNF